MEGQAMPVEQAYQQVLEHNRYLAEQNKYLIAQINLLKNKLDSENDSSVSGSVFSENEREMEDNNIGDFTPVKSKNKRRKKSSESTKSVEIDKKRTKSNSNNNNKINNNKKNTQPINNNISIQTNSNIQNKATTSTITNNGAQKQIKPPSIIAFYNNHKDLQYKIKSITNNTNTLIYIRNEVVKIQCLTKIDFEKIKGMLQKQQIHYYTYTPRDEKPITMVLKNISTTYEAAEIHAAIQEKDPQINVIQVKNLNSWNWLIQVKDINSQQKINNMRSLLGFGIRVERYRGKKLLQCKNCQRYNHLATNCNMPYRCMKCTENHEPGKCKIPAKENNNDPHIIEKEDGTKNAVKGIPLTCVNCGKNHPANYAQCEYRIKIEEKKRTQYNQIANKPIRIQSNFVRQNVSYSAMAKTSQNTKSNSNQTNANFDINKEVEQHFGKDLNTCLNKINSFIPKYKGLNQNERKNALFSLMFELCLS